MHQTNFISRVLASVMSVSVMSVSVLTGSLLTSILLSGCSTWLMGPAKSSPVEKRLRHRVRKLEQDLHSHRTNNNNLSEENQFLRDQIERLASGQPVPGYSNKVRASRTVVLGPGVGRRVKAVRLVYAKVLELYKGNHLTELEKAVDLLAKGYPQSIYLDDALYLAGALSLFKGQTKKAYHYLDRVIQDYPHSNRVAASLFGKGMLQKKVKRFGAAIKTMQRVVDNYPGSPESYRASLEIKRLKKWNL